MHTADKRKKFQETNPELFKKVYELIDNNDTRELDTLMQDIDDKEILQYIITLLCDDIIDKESKIQYLHEEAAGEDI